MPERVEQDLTRVEQQLVMLAVQKREHARQEVTQVRAQADAFEKEAAALFTLETAPVVEAHGFAPGTFAMFDARPDGKTMYLWVDVKGEGAVVGSIPKEPLDPLS